MNQDFIAWVGQGRQSDRENEHLGESDRGVILMRRKMIEQAELVRDGGTPKGLVFDPQKNHAIHLPRVGDTFGTLNFGETVVKAPRNRHLYGQPQEVLDEMDRIWTERSRGAEVVAGG
jgi:5,5'-dehydrodivanillate O-demethylase